MSESHEFCPKGLYVTQTRVCLFLVLYYLKDADVGFPWGRSLPSGTVAGFCLVSRPVRRGRWLSVRLVVREALWRLCLHLWATSR